MAEKLLSVEDVARILQVSVSKVRQLVNDGEIRSIRVGRQIRITQADLDDYIERQSSNQ